MDSDQIEGLISKFHSIPGDAEAEPWEKVKIIRTLEGARDPRVLSFFLRVLSDGDEFDLARIEILKILRLRECSGDAERVEIGEAIAGVLVGEEDVLVKQYAAMALEWNYAGVESVLEAVTRTLLNEEEDTGVRANALSVVESAGPTPETVGLLKGLMNDRDIGKYVLTTLAKWEAL